jgi:predicted PurR-regulated permease PerM
LRAEPDDKPPPGAPGAKPASETAWETAVTFRPVEESAWSGRPNPWLERHPFLAGYAFVFGLTVLVISTNLTAFVMSFLLLYLVSDFLTNDVRRYIRFVPKALLFSLLYFGVIALFTVLAYRTIPSFVRQLPTIAEQFQTEALAQFEHANQRWGVADWVDPQEVAGAIASAATKSIGYLAKKFQTFYKGFIYFIFALVINLALYHRIEKIDATFDRRPTSLMSFFYRFTTARVRVFYFYFKRVMGGQIIISAINTAISSIVVVGLGLPHKALLIVVIFLCGLFPVVGNLASNTILTISALVNVGMLGAAICLGLLVGIHKLEYFLNSRIIGEIVNLPMAVTLTALIVAEVTLGVSGLLLAIPLTLFLRHELDQIPGLPAKGKGG